MRDKIGERPYVLARSGNGYTIQFYPMKKGAKDPDRILLSLAFTKQDFDKLAAKIK